MRVARLAIENMALGIGLVAMGVAGAVLAAFDDHYPAWITLQFFPLTAALMFWRASYGRLDTDGLETIANIDDQAYVDGTVRILLRLLPVFAIGVLLLAFSVRTGSSTIAPLGGLMAGFGLAMFLYGRRVRRYERRHGVELYARVERLRNLQRAAVGDMYRRPVADQ